MANMKQNGGPAQNYETVSTGESTDSNNSTSVKLQRRLGLFNGVALIVGTIVGSGIFVSPKGVLRETGSVGVALIVWGVAGILCLLGALCFAELGTCIRKSGGQYAYMYTAFGPLPAFLYLWVFVLVIGPAANAVIALTFGYYALQPFYPSCDQPDAAVRLLAAVAICKYTFYMRPKKSCLFPVTLPEQAFIQRNCTPKFFLPFQLPINVKHA